MTEPDSLTEHNAAIEDALDGLADAALDWFDASPAEPAQVRNRLLNAADAYGHAVRARAEWRAEVHVKAGRVPPLPVEWSDDDPDVRP